MSDIILIQKRPFVHNSVCSQFLEGLFAIFAEWSQFCLRPLPIGIQEEITHFAGWEGGVMGTKIVNNIFVNKLAFPIHCIAEFIVTTSSTSRKNPQRSSSCDLVLDSYRDRFQPNELESGKKKEHKD